MHRPSSSRLQQQVARELAAAVRRVERQHKYSEAVGQERRRARRHQVEQHACCLLGDAVSDRFAGARAVAVANEVEVQVAGAPVLEQLVGVPLCGTDGEVYVYGLPRQTSSALAHRTSWRGREARRTPTHAVLAAHPPFGES